MIGGRTVSLSTGSMNRLEHLLRALPTWLARPEIDEVLLVDWGSKVPLAEALREFADDRIHIVRVKADFWENARCHNLEFRLARGELLLRLDNDHLLHDDFFARHPLSNENFYAGNWRQVSESQIEQRNLSGILWVRRSYLRRANGYNERLIHFGVEDDDMYERLEALGLERCDIDLSTAEHIHHSDVDRYRHLRIAAERPELVDNRSRSWDQCIANSSVAKRLILQVSLQENQRAPWTTKDVMTSWMYRAVDSRYGEAEELCPDLLVEHDDVVIA